jgi:tRNA (guanine-N7-)-methyltransferase
VEEVHNWMVDHITMHPLFRALTAQEISEDKIVPLLYESTEEGQKVTRNSGKKWSAVFQRLDNPS